MEGGGRTVYMVKKQTSSEEQKQISSNVGPMRILTVSREGAVFYKLQEGNGETTQLVPEEGFPSYPTATLGKFAPSKGRLAVIADPSLGLHVVDCLTGKEVRLILKQTAISALSFSPLDTWFITCEKFVQGEKNLIVWDLASGSEVAQFEWKKGSKEGTKSIKFTEDERYMGRLSSRTQIEVYENGNYNAPKVTINANEETLAKKGGKKEESKKNKFWFDGFEFIPAHTAQGGTPHQYLFAW